MKDIIDKLKNFGEDPPKILENIEKGKALVYTYRQMDGLKKGYGYLTTDEVIKIDLEKNIIYFIETRVRSLGYENDMIEYENLFIFDCNIEAVLALIKTIDY